MKTGRRLIALNLAILLILTLFPMSAAAAGSQTLTIGTPIVTTELYDAGYNFTPAETGLYKFEVSCYNETENRVASCGDLQIYGGADSSAWNGIEDKNDNYTTYSKTRQLTAGTTYTIDFMGHPGLRDDPDTYRYTLSVERVVCGTLSSSPSQFNTSDAVYYQFTPSSTGWYTIALTVSGTVRLYDQDFNNIGTAYVEAGSGGATQTEYSEYLTGGSTYYIWFTSGSTTSGTISCAPSEFGSVTTEETKTIWLGGALTYLTFTAATSGSHTITAAIGTVNDSMYLTSLGLYSATGEQLDGEWFKEGEMSIDITRDLEAGMTYYIAAGGYGGPVTVSVAAPGSEGGTIIPPSADYAQIVGLYPENGADNVGYDASNQPYFQITFDRNISSMDTSNGSHFADLDFSKGTMKIFRSSDDALIYEVTYDDWMSDIYGSEITGTTSSDIRVVNGSTLRLDPFNAHLLLTAGTSYYITVDEGFIQFEDGSVNPAIEKGKWRFTTEATTFTFLGFDGKTERTYEYYFSESFFTTPSTFYNHELAKMSLNLALSAFNSATAAESGYSRQEAAKNVVDLMQKMGFKEIDTTSYEGKPTRYSIAEAIGQKQIQDHSQEYTLIAVAIRGGGYEMEWASNVSVFSDREHQGFSLAANDVMNDLLQYISRYVEDTDHIKLWITGYSRGAAVANLMSAKLSQQLENNNLGDLTIEQRDIYTYTFATPMARAADGYDVTTIDRSIFNIINPVDIVPKFTPDVWGYYRYGYTYCLPSIETNSKVYYDLLNDVGDEMLRIAGGNYAGTFSTSQGAILQDLVDILDIMKPDGDISIILQNVLADYFVDKYSFSYNDNGFAHFITDIKNVIDTAGTLKDIAEVNIISLAVDKLLKPAIIDGGLETAEMLFDITERAHYPEVYLAWMNTIDEDDLTNGTYRKMYYNCPVDISVYDENGTFVAGFKNDEAININDDAVDAYLDADGQKVIVLPLDREYEFSVTATDNGVMTYTVEECSAASNQVERIISYYNVAVDSRDQFTGKVDAVIENSTIEAEYSLFRVVNGEREKLVPTVNQSSDAIKEYAVTISVIGNGTAVGGGIHSNGQFVQVVAVADEGESFVGWYGDEGLLSEDTEYRFLVDDDIAITAKFTTNQEIPDENDPAPEPEPTPDLNPSQPSWPGSSSTGSSSSSSNRFDIDVENPADGTVETDPASGWEGDRVIITLTPDNGYMADGVTVTDEDGNEVDTVRRSDGSYLFYMPDGDVTIEASFVPEPEESEPTIDLSFSDVLSGTYYYDAVYWAVEHGVTNGTSTTTFSPERTVTRAEMVTFLWRAAGSPEPESSTNPFTDVTSGTYYYDAVLWAVENGITNGTTATTFSPERTVTRAEAVTFQWRSAGSPAVSGGSFEDVPSNAYYAVAVEWAVGNDITNGTNPAGTLFSPEVGVSRAQAVTFLYRYLG